MIRNFVLENANAPGANANVTLGGAAPDRISWRGAYADGSPAFYFMDDGSQAEWGVGTVHWGTPNYISRDTVVGNTAGTTNRLTFGGAVQVYNEIPGERLPYINGQVLFVPGAHVESHAGGVPIGASMDYWGANAPTGWVFCDGRWLSRTSYSLLFSVIGTSYGAGDGSSTFAVPDCQGVATYGKNQPAAGGNTGNTRLGPWQNSGMGAAVGDWQFHQHNHPLVLQDPGHAHQATVVDPGHLHAYFHPWVTSGSTIAAGPGYDLFDQILQTDDNHLRASGVAVAVQAHSTDIAGRIDPVGTGVWQNVSPGIICNKIIYAGPSP